LVWDYFLEINPSIALLQEVGKIPLFITNEYKIIALNPINKKNLPQRFQTAILVKGNIGEEIILRSKWDWVNNELERFKGNLLSHQIIINNTNFNVVSVYSPAWPVDPKRLEGIDVNPVKLKLNPKVWTTEILWAALNCVLNGDGNWIIGGDLNISETFDYLWKGGPRGNKEIIDRFEALGLVECLRKFNGKLVPTFRNPSNRLIIHQMDHLFVTLPLWGKLVFCSTGDPERVFSKSLSDHLPIFADIDL
jgi:hypothetical protein